MMNLWLIGQGSQDKEFSGLYELGLLHKPEV